MTSPYLELPRRALSEVTSARKTPSPRDEALSVLRDELDRMDVEMKVKILQRAKLAELIIHVARGMVAPETALRMVKS